MDSFDMAMMAVNSADETTIDSLKTGKEKEHPQHKRTLEEVGLTEIDATGQDFDPTLHEAMSRKEAEEAEEDGRDVCAHVCSHNDRCEVCDDGGEALLPCDYCNLAYHTGCLAPPLIIAEGEDVAFACPLCVAMYPTHAVSTTTTIKSSLHKIHSCAYCTYANQAC